MMQVCPVCHGGGIVPLGFYQPCWVGRLSMASGPTADLCRTCAGYGVLYDSSTSAVSVFDWQQVGSA